MAVGTDTFSTRCTTELLGTLPTRGHVPRRCVSGVILGLGVSSGLMETLAAGLPLYFILLSDSFVCSLRFACLQSCNHVS